MTQGHGRGGTWLAALSVALVLSACGSSGGGGGGGSGGGGGDPAGSSTLTRLGGTVYSLSPVTDSQGAAVYERRVLDGAQRTLSFRGGMGPNPPELAAGTISATGKLDVTLPTTAPQTVPVATLTTPADSDGLDVSCQGTVTSSDAQLRAASGLVQLDGTNLLGAASVTWLDDLSPAGGGVKGIVLVYADRAATVSGRQTCTVSDGTTSFKTDSDWNVPLRRGWNPVTVTGQVAASDHITVTYRSGVAPQVWFTLGAATPQPPGGEDPPQTGDTTVVIQNRLANPVTLTINARAYGPVAAGSTGELRLGRVPSLDVAFRVASSTSREGRPVGDPMGGYFDTVTSPGKRQVYTIDNVIGDEVYFAPRISNESGTRALMGVNPGLLAENFCQCVVPPRTSDVDIGYYRLYSNTSVVAFREADGYGNGPYAYWDGLSVQRGDGTVGLRLTSGGGFSGPRPARRAGDAALPALSDPHEHAGEPARPFDPLGVLR